MEKTILTTKHRLQPQSPNLLLPSTQSLRLHQSQLKQLIFLLWMTNPNKLRKVARWFHMGQTLEYNQTPCRLSATIKPMYPYVRSKPKTPNTYYRDNHVTLRGRCDRRRNNNSRYSRRDYNDYYDYNEYYYQPHERIKTRASNANYPSKDNHYPLRQIPMTIDFNYPLHLPQEQTINSCNRYLLFN